MQKNDTLDNFFRNSGSICPFAKIAADNEAIVYAQSSAQFKDQLISFLTDPSMQAFVVVADKKPTTHQKAKDRVYNMFKRTLTELLSLQGAHLEEIVPYVKSQMAMFDDPNSPQRPMLGYDNKPMYAIGMGPNYAPGHPRYAPVLCLIVTWMDQVQEAAQQYPASVTKIRAAMKAQTGAIYDADELYLRRNPGGKESRRDLKISITKVNPPFIKFEIFDFEENRIGWLLLRVPPLPEEFQEFEELAFQIHFAKVEKPFRRQGIMTMLHERAADWAFQRKMRLFSAKNTQMTRPAEHFWIKQVNEKRAKRIFINRKRNIYFYALEYPPPATLKRNPSEKIPKLESLRSEFCSAAQKVYDEWEQDEVGHSEWYGCGGICHDIADAICDVLSTNDISCTTFSPSIGEVHVWAVADIDDDAYRVDIGPNTYEQGGGYTWRKIPGVSFEDDDIIIESMGYPFSDYLED